jgi:hypothetical protein
VRRRSAALSAAAALGLTGCIGALPRRADLEIGAPPTFAAASVHLGMPLASAHVLYPAREPQWKAADTISLILAPPTQELARAQGLFLLPVGEFHDEKLSDLLSLVGFRGGRLAPEEVEALHARLLKECEDLYGTVHDRPVARVDAASGANFTAVAWHNYAYTATLYLAQPDAAAKTGKIAVLDLAAVRRQPTRAEAAVTALLGKEPAEEDIPVAGRFLARRRPVRKSAGPPRGVPNFREVDPGVYRGGQPTAAGWESLKALGVRTVVKLDLPREGSDAAAQSLGMAVVDASGPPSDLTNMLGAPTPERLKLAVKTLEDSRSRPVFVHCLHGQDRTGLVVGLYRVLHDGYSKRRAWREMRVDGFHRSLHGLREVWERFDGKTVPGADAPD